MLGLTASLSLASQALDAQDGAIAVTNNNIANVNTPGYTRQIVTLSANALAGGGSDGVTYGGYTSVRDELLQMAIESKTSDQSSLTQQSNALATVQTAFSSTTSGVGAEISNFFSAVSGLSATPTDASARQAVLSAAGQLANGFHQAAQALTTAGSQANTVVSSTVAQINGLTKQIAGLNGDRKSTRLNSSHSGESRMPSSA